MVDWQIFAAGTFFFMLTIGLFIVKTIAEKLFGAKIPTFLLYVPLGISGILMLEAFGFFNWVSGLVFYKSLYFNAPEIIIGLLLLLVSVYNKKLTTKINFILLLLGIILILDGTRALPILSGIQTTLNNIAGMVGSFTLSNPVVAIVTIILTIILITALVVFIMWLVSKLTSKVKGGVKS